jgi:hypothetical protein
MNGFGFLSSSSLEVDSLSEWELPGRSAGLPVLELDSFFCFLPGLPRVNVVNYFSKYFRRKIGVFDSQYSSAIDHSTYTS